MTKTANGETQLTQNARGVTWIIPASRTIEGGGFEVFRPFPGPSADWFDPFLLLDEMAPSHHEPGEAIGAPPHPHRGFETVTYILQGEVEHRDSAGNHGIIGPGDVQWMTAGDGILHSEMPSPRVQREGGVGHGLQLWVNLPASLRRTAPKYQALTANDMASVSGDGWLATPLCYSRVTIQPGATLHIPTTDGHTALVYAFAGTAAVGPERDELLSQHLAVFDNNGGEIVLSVAADASESFDCVVLTGEPIGEPMVRYGPFVMNAAAEIDEGISDFNSGAMGTIPATGTT